MTPITVNSGSASTTEQGVYLGCLSFDTCGSHGERAWQAPVGIIPPWVREICIGCSKHRPELGTSFRNVAEAEDPLCLHAAASRR